MQAIWTMYILHSIFVRNHLDSLHSCWICTIAKNLYPCYLLWMLLFCARIYGMIMFSTNNWCCLFYIYYWFNCALVEVIGVMLDFTSCLLFIQMFSWGRNQCEFCDIPHLLDTLELRVCQKTTFFSSMLST